MFTEHGPLGRITLDAYLIARHSALNDLLPEGRAWERTVVQLLCGPGLDSRQPAGLTTLFGSKAASGCDHEIDGAARGWKGRVIVEAKSKANGINKADIALFGMKTFDHYRSQLPHSANEPWWRLMISATPVADPLRRLCAAEGIILCDPAYLPIPVLLQIAARPIADQFLDELKLSEIVRLGEPACEPMCKRWSLDQNGRLVLCARGYRSADMEDLLWLQEELTGDVLDLYDTYRPGRLERRIEQLMFRLELAHAYA
jgi:hypothetical protein